MNEPCQSRVFHGKQADLGETWSKVSTGLSYSSVLTFHTKRKKTTLILNSLIDTAQAAVVDGYSWFYMMSMLFGSIRAAKQVRLVAIQPACSRGLFPHTQLKLLLQSHRNNVLQFRINRHELLNSCSIYKDSKMKFKEVSSRVRCEWDGGLYRWVDKTASHHLKTCPTLGSTEGQGQLHQPLQ